MLKMPCKAYWPSLGLERRSEGGKALESAYRALKAAHGAQFQPLQEAAFYLIITDLQDHLSVKSLIAVEDSLLSVSSCHVLILAMSQSVGIVPTWMRKMHGSQSKAHKYGILNLHAG